MSQLVFYAMRQFRLFKIPGRHLATFAVSALVTAWLATRVSSAAPRASISCGALMVSRSRSNFDKFQMMFADLAAESTAKNLEDGIRRDLQREMQVHGVDPQTRADWLLIRRKKAKMFANLPEYRRQRAMMAESFYDTVMRSATLRYLKARWPMYPNLIRVVWKNTGGETAKDLRVEIASPYEVYAVECPGAVVTRKGPGTVLLSEPLLAPGRAETALISLSGFRTDRRDLAAVRTTSGDPANTIDEATTSAAEPPKLYFAFRGSSFEEQDIRLILESTFSN